MVLDLSVVRVAFGLEMGITVAQIFTHHCSAVRRAAAQSNGCRKGEMEKQVILHPVPQAVGAAAADCAEYEVIPALGRGSHRRALPKRPSSNWHPPQGQRGGRRSISAALVIGGGYHCGCGDEILGKPKPFTEKPAMLPKIAGQDHMVFTPAWPWWGR